MHASRAICNVLTQGRTVKGGSNSKPPGKSHPAGTVSFRELNLDLLNTPMQDTQPYRTLLVARRLDITQYYLHEVKRKKTTFSYWPILISQPQNELRT